MNACLLQGDCIPPHIDSMDFARPFCTVSLLSEQSIMFAQKLVPAGPGEFTARDGCKTVSIPLPKGEPGQGIVVVRRLVVAGWHWVAQWAVMCSLVFTVLGSPVLASPVR